MGAENNWSLEGELEKLSGMPSIQESLFALRVLPAQDPLCQVRLPKEGWYRSGAETYLYRFSIVSNGLSQELALKACVAFAFDRTLEGILESWMKRRQILELNGIKSPTLYASGNGVILEEYIPYSARELLYSEGAAKDAILIALAEMAGVLTRLRFQPIGIFHDIRSHGFDAVMIDFGQDLGPAGIGESESDDALLVQLLGTLNQWKIDVPRRFKGKLEDIYFSQFRRDSNES
jgi:hypothetical protein